MRIGGLKGALFSALIIASLMLILLLAPLKAAGFSGSGSGTAGDPYIITTVEQLQAMENNLTAHYALGNDIDASATISWNGGAGFEPIGTDATPFTGSLDGRGYKIYDLYINRSYGTNYAGLFGFVESGGVVENVGLKNVNVIGRSDSVGGLVGSNYGDVSDSFSTGTVSGALSVGGLVGSNIGRVSNSYSTGSVTSAGGGYAGGLVGYNEGTVSNSYSTGPVTGEYAGGLVGFNWGTVSNSFWNTQTSGQATSAGGTGRTTESMKNVRTYTDVAWSEGLSSAWDFGRNPYGDAGNEDIWDINPDVNDGYPFLAAAAAPGEPSRGVTISILPVENEAENERSVTFMITVTNTGENTDTFTLTATDTKNWVPTLSLSLATLPAGASRTGIGLSVTIPSDAVEGDSTTITVTARGTGYENSTTCTAMAIEVPPAVQVGVKAGDWVKFDYTISGAPSGTNLPQWIKLEFLSVEGTSANVRVTMHMADGTEQSDNMPVDVAAGGGTIAGLSGFVIPADSKTGDSINMSGYGAVTIAGEKTKTYAGASRTVVFANIPQYGLSYYWDKQTGIMVEASAISGAMTGTAKATETNMWQAGPQAPSGGSNLPLIAGVVVVIVVIGVAVVLYMRRR